MPSAQALADRGQQYRNYDPGEFMSAFDETPGNAAEVDKKIRQALKTIESARFLPFLEATSSMFSRLDRDEQELFTRRNPDVVQWMVVFNRASDFDPYPEFYDLASTILTEGDRVMRDDVTVPLFERPELQEATLLRDMRFRRRSYRNWSPFEFIEVGEEPHELVEAGAVELGVIAPGTAEEMDGWPLEYEGRAIARAVLDRVEDGRFKSMLKAGSNFFYPLDPDERRLFANRNPGIMVWFHVFGFTEHKPHYGQGLFPLSNIDWPTLGEADA